MPEKRRNGNEPSQSRAAATSAAEAAAFGTAAGAIVLGVAEARARQKDAETVEAVHDTVRTAPERPAFPEPAAATVAGDGGQITPAKSGVAGELRGAGSGMGGDAMPQAQAADDQHDGPPTPETGTPATETARDDDGSDGSSRQEPAATDAEAEPVTASGVGSTVPGDGGATPSVAGAGSTAISPLDPAALSERIAGEVAAAVGKISQGIADGLAPDEIGTSIAEQIRDTVSLITKDIETALSGAGGNADNLTQDLSEGIEANVADALAPVAGLAQPTIDAVPSLVGDIAGKVDDVIETGLAPSLELALPDVADIPATLLGAEAASDLPGGILSDIFYSDGAADPSGSSPPEVPAASPATDAFSAASDILSEAAASTMDAAGDLPLIDIAGVSYTDAPDAAYGGMTSGLNALHLL